MTVAVGWTAIIERSRLNRLPFYSKPYLVAYSVVHELSCAHFLVDVRFSTSSPIQRHEQGHAAAFRVHPGEHVEGPDVFLRQPRIALRIGQNAVGNAE